MYSGGKSFDGDYPLLSTAIEGGLFHPRCKDSTSTYYEGITTLKPVSKEEMAEMDRREKLEEQQLYYKNQAKKNKRIADNSLDKDNRRAYQSRADVCKQKADEIGEKLTKSVAISNKNDIIAMEESVKRVKDENYTVNWNIINSNEYNNKFTSLSNNERAISTIKTRARWALRNRDGVNTEELYAIDLFTGDVIGEIIDQHYPHRVKRTNLFNRKLNEADSKGTNILLIHNHPRGLPPSIGDINALVTNKNVVGITVGHDGSVYYYTRPKTIINEIDYNVRLRHNKQLDEIECMEAALFDLQEQFGFTILKL